MIAEAKYEKIVTYVKVSKEMMVNTEYNDYIHDQLTALLYGSVLTASKEEGELPVFVPRPTFFDWLLRRTKTITVQYNIRQLMKVDKIEGSLPVIELRVKEELKYREGG